MAEEPIDDLVLEKLYDISKDTLARTFQHIQELQLKAAHLLLIQVLFLGLYTISVNIQFTLNILPDPILGLIMALSFLASFLGIYNSSEVLKIQIYADIGIKEVIDFAEAFPEKNTFIKPLIGDWSNLQDTNLKINELNTNKIKWSIRGLIIGLVLGIFETFLFTI